MTMTKAKKMKTCTRCNTTKPKSDFNKHKQKKDGLNSWCRVCTREESKLRTQTREYKIKKSTYDKQYRLENLEAITVKVQNYANTHKAEKALYDKQRREQQGQSRLQQKRGYYHNQGGKEVMYKWRKDNPDKVKASTHNTGVKRRHQLSLTTLSNVELHTWLSTQSPICTYCGIICPDFHIDHIEPLATGGLHEISNLTISCPTCNCSKGAKSLIHWLATKQQTDRS